jgi:hypothetical protein
MAGVPVPAYQEFWAEKRSALQAEYKSLVNTHHDAAPCLQQLYKVLSDIEALAGCTPATVGKTDRRKEFLGSAFQKLLKEKNIEHRVCKDPVIKCSMVETFNRTIKTKLYQGIKGSTSFLTSSVLQKRSQ